MPAAPTVDPRGPRFAAGVTSVVLVVVLITGWWPLLAVQTGVFAIGAFVGLRPAPYAVLYRRLVAPRLAPAGEFEDATPVRFAQAVGFGFALAGTLGYATGVTALGLAATALALLAALLNAVFNFCLGCEAFLLIQRTRPAATGQRSP